MILTFVLFGSAAVGGLFGWHQGTKAMRFPKQYFSPPRDMAYDEWLADVEERTRKQRLVKTMVYATAATIAGFLLLSFFAVGR